MRKINEDNSENMFKIIDDMKVGETVVISGTEMFDRDEHKELKECITGGWITPVGTKILEAVKNEVIKAEHMYLYFTGDIIFDGMEYVKLRDYSGY